MSVFSLSLCLSTLLSCVSLVVIVSTANALGNETDRLALLAFRSEITQDPHGVLSSWNGSFPFCDWEGVICSHKHQRVAALNLRSKGLVGSISPHLGNLSFLRELDLANNSFHGEIPSELGKLFRLEILYFSNNSLVGEIPVNISLCSNLMELALSHNGLVGRIPKELGYFPKLLFMSLGFNNLSGGLPPSLGNLTSIETLAVTSNSLGGAVPITLTQLIRLKFLALSSNVFTGVFPLPLYNLSLLEIVSVSDNKLRGNLPTEIGHMLPNLQLLYLSLNQFSGSIPVSLFNISKLKEIDIGDNQFGGNVPSNVGNLKDLKILNLQWNNFGTGRHGDLDFFSGLSNCSNIQQLVLSSNRFGGTLPISIGNFSKELFYLDLGQNHIFGNIPFEIGKIQNLIALNLGFNDFTGSIPMAVQDLHKLQGLSLDFNQLSGHVPSFTRNMSDLYFLEFNNNIFEGSISSFLDNHNLQELNISHNNFSGTIPMEVGSLKNFRYFDVSHNKLSGEIPNTLASSEMLVNLKFQDNFFRGPIPSSFSSLKSLEVLDVSRNNISGMIPKDLGKLPFLQTLNLSFNKLEGEVPTEGLFRNTSAFSVFGNEKICGGIPELKLGTCHVGKSKTHKTHLALKVTLGVFIFTFLVTISMVMYLRKKPKAKPISEDCSQDPRRVSFNDLYKATDGFSMSNLIGVGSYGSVYKGVLQQIEGTVAVKVFTSIDEHRASKSFMAECETLREVRHRNLLKILTVCSSVDFNGEAFKALVFKYMPNGSLEDWLHPSSNAHVRGNLSIYQRLDIAIDIAFALDYLQNYAERPIVHCDLKPSNVLLGDDMTAHVGDFGLAKFLSKTGHTSQSEKIETDSVAVRGTIGYIPPEYGMGAEVSTQGDVYSYGILILEMFTGKRPTDNMFEDGSSLRDYCKTALPRQLMDTIDMRMLSEAKNTKSTTQMKECLSSIMNIGVSCSAEITTERMNMDEVLKDLHSIKKALLPV